MHLREGEFSRAHTDFFEAFKNYDESGSPRSVCVCVCMYVCVCVHGLKSTTASGNPLCNLTKYNSLSIGSCVVIVAVIFL